MAQTATLLSREETVFLRNHHVPDVLVNPSIKETTSDAGKHFLAQSGYLRYKDRIRITFKVLPVYRSYFGLLRGLIDFHRSSAYAFEYNKDDSSIQVDIPADEHNSLNTFLLLIFSMLRKEVAFKTTLKEVLQFEAEYRRKKDLVYHSFINIR